MEEVTDKLETLILMALDASHSDASTRTETRGLTEGHWEVSDQGRLLPFDAMRPASSYTFDMADTSRIFATTPDYLAAHPADVLGDEAETIMLGGGLLKWYGYRRLRKPPRGVSYLGKPTHWYEMHGRIVAQTGHGEYIKRLVALNACGSPLLVRMQGHVVAAPAREGESLILSASLIEDAHRAGTMLAAVKDATEIKFPVPLDDYKDVFAERDGPMNGARRKAIVHWVARHLRHSTRGNEFAVKKHTRGAQEFTIDGLRIRLTPNAIGEGPGAASCARSLSADGLAGSRSTEK